MLYGYGFSGTSAPVELPLATAVQASACVPGAFSPCTLTLGDIAAQGTGRLGVVERRGTGRLVLVDGGVYDNMADEWEYGFRGRQKSWPSLAEAQPAPAALLL